MRTRASERSADYAPIISDGVILKFDPRHGTGSLRFALGDARISFGRLAVQVGDELKLQAGSLVKFVLDPRSTEGKLWASSVWAA